MVNGQIIKQQTYEKPSKSGDDRINISRIDGSTNVAIELIDMYGFKYVFR